MVVPGLEDPPGLEAPLEFDAPPEFGVPPEPGAPPEVGAPPEFTELVTLADEERVLGTLPPTLVALHPSKQTERHRTATILMLRLHGTSATGDLRDARAVEPYRNFENTTRIAWK